jgi:hypothetical protein
MSNFSQLLLSRTEHHLLTRCYSAHYRSCLSSAFTLALRWHKYFADLAVKKKLDEASFLACVDEWIEDLLAFVSALSPHACGVRLRKIMMKG